MVKTDRFIFLEMPKCATTFISTFLCETFDDAEWVESGRHNGLKEPSDKFVFASIRNPFDWYVSMYHDTKDKLDHPYHPMTKDRTFIEFMYYLFTTKHDDTYGYDFKCMKKRRIGYCTLRYDNTYYIEPDFVIRFENLYSDIAECFKALGSPLTINQVAKLVYSEKKRVSVGRLHYSCYYTENPSLVELVLDRDRKIFEKYNYGFGDK